ncbi:MAG: GSCFA domain-containing protein [Bacteroidales bacterium]|nr:GSCFA domain-containing protein [Bacteroidales bacterium]
MDFRTIVPTRECIFELKPTDTALFLGSCFAENISSKLCEGLFDCYSNPYGAAYNPMSVSAQLKRIAKNEKCKNEETIKRDDLYYSLLAHTKIYGLSKQELEDNINIITKSFNSILHKAKLIAITFGTAWTYKLASTRKIVANCHKLPQDQFEREMLTVEEIVEEWRQVLSELREINHDAHIVFTVSPIRHLKETAHGNQLSKSVLLMAIDKIVGTSENTSYFESYELMLDDLRDYRFYAEDMVHPSEMACEYIYEHFANGYLTAETKQMICEGRKISSALNHRPLTGSNAYGQFVNQLEHKTEVFCDKYKLNRNGKVIKHVIKNINDIKMALKNAESSCE